MTEKKNVINVVKEKLEATVDQVKDKGGEVLEQAHGNFKEFSKEVNKKVQEIQNKMYEQKLENQKEKYNPVFDFEEFDHYSMPAMINIVDEYDGFKAEACENAIALNQKLNGMPVLIINKNNAKSLKLKFYPKVDDTVFYLHPTHRDEYIELNSYFDVILEAKVAELKQIAQSLGAKHFKVSYMEKTKTIQKRVKGGKLNLKADKFNNVDVENKSETEKYTYRLLEVKSENSFGDGGDPTSPKLDIWKGNPTIENLVKMRLHETHPLTKECFELRLNEMNTIKKKDAVKIAGALKGLKFDGGKKIEDDASLESERILRYEIDF